MSAGTLKCLHLAYFSQPAEDRAVYRLIRRDRARRIVQVGIETGVFALRMIEVAQQRSPAGTVHYTGIDPFESRSEVDGPGLSLKTAHRMLSASGAQIQLVPGRPDEALARKANSLAETDLLIINVASGHDALGDGWFYVPRMLHSQSLVFVKRPPSSDTSKGWRPIPPEEVAMLASTEPRRRAA